MPGTQDAPTAESSEQHLADALAALAAQPDSPDRLYRVALAYCDHGDSAAALEAAERLIHLAPEDAGSWHRYAFVVSTLGDHAAARRAIEKALTLTDSAEIRASLAWELGTLGDHRAAVQEGERALASGLIAERRSWLHQTLASCYSALDDEEAAFCHARAAAEADPDDAGAHCQAAQGLISRDQNAEALPHLERAAALAPEDAETWSTLGRTADRLGDRVRARDAYERALGLKNDTETRARLAGVLRGLGEYEAAVEQGERALRDGETERAAWLHAVLGYCYLEIGELDAALAHAEQWTSLSPEEPMAWSALAIAADEVGDPRRAREAVERAVTLAPDSFSPRRHLAALLQELNALPAAIEQYVRLLDLAEDAATRSRLYADLAYSHARLEEPEAAWTSIQEALRTGPEEDYARYYVALACKHLGDMDNAQRHLEKAIEIDPDPWSRLSLADVLAERDDYDTADAILRELLDTEVREEAQKERVYNRMEQGRIAEAVRLAREEAEARPDSARAWLTLSWALRSAAEHRGAGEALEKARALDPNGRWVWWEAAEGERRRPADHSIATGSPTRRSPSSTM